MKLLQVRWMPSISSMNAKFESVSARYGHVLPVVVKEEGGEPFNKLPIRSQAGGDGGGRKWPLGYLHNERTYLLSFHLFSLVVSIMTSWHHEAEEQLCSSAPRPTFAIECNKQHWHCQPCRLLTHKLSKYLIGTQVDRVRQLQTVSFKTTLLNRKKWDSPSLSQ